MKEKRISPVIAWGIAILDAVGIIYISQRDIQFEYLCILVLQLFVVLIIFRKSLAFNRKNPNDVQDTQSTDWGSVGILAGLIVISVLFLFMGSALDAVVSGFPGIAGGLVGACLGRQSRSRAWVGAFIGTIVVAGITLGFILATCLLCI